MTYCTNHGCAVASHQADYFAPPMLHWIHQLYMSHPHHVCVGVHSKCSVKREVKASTPCYITIIQTNIAHKCIRFIFSQKPLTPTSSDLTGPSSGMWTSPTDQQAAPSNFVQFLSATHILHQDFPAALLQAKGQYIKQEFYSIIVLLDDGPVSYKTWS
jgi:hypothetical protein